MGVVTGLANIQKQIDSRPQGGGERVDDRELTRNLKPGKDRTIRFAQELDETSPYYREDLGLGLVVSEHVHPDIWWLRLVDTFDEEGGSWGADNGWRSNLTLYINVVDVNTGEVFFLSRSVLGGLGQQIVENAGDRGSLTDSVWKIKKKGEGMKTRYNLSLVSITDEALDVDPEDLIDFEKSVLNQVPYGKQGEFVRQIEERVAKKQAENESGDASSDDDDDDDVW